MPTDLQELNGIGDTMAQRIDADTVEELAKANAEDISTQGLSTERAQGYIDQANRYLSSSMTLGKYMEEVESRGHIPTGLDGLDEAIEGGLEEKGIITITGASGTGKSKLSLQFALNAIEHTDKKAIYIETERSDPRPKTIKNMVDDREQLEKVKKNMIVKKAFTVPQQKASYEAVRDGLPDDGSVEGTLGEDDVGLIVVDSFTARMRSIIDGRTDLTKREQMMSEHLDILENAIDKYGCPLILTGQVYSDVSGSWGGDKMWGGNVFEHRMLFRLFTKESKGEAKKAVVQDHPSEPDEEIEFFINDDGIEEKT